MSGEIRAEHEAAGRPEATTIWPIMLNARLQDRGNCLDGQMSVRHELQRPGRHEDRTDNEEGLTYHPVVGGASRSKSSAEVADNLRYR